MNISQRFSFITLMAYEEMIFFLKVSLSVDMANNQIQKFGQKLYVW